MLIDEVRESNALKLCSVTVHSAHMSLPAVVTLRNCGTTLPGFSNELEILLWKVLENRASLIAPATGGSSFHYTAPPLSLALALKCHFKVLKII